MTHYLKLVIIVGSIPQVLISLRCKAFHILVANFLLVVDPAAITLLNLHVQMFIIVRKSSVSAASFMSCSQGRTFEM